MLKQGGAFVGVSALPRSETSDVQTGLGLWPSSWQEIWRNHMLKQGGAFVGVSLVPSSEVERLMIGKLQSLYKTRTRSIYSLTLGVGVNPISGETYDL